MGNNFLTSKMLLTVKFQLKIMFNRGFKLFKIKTLCHNNNNINRYFLIFLAKISVILTKIIQYIKIYINYELYTTKIFKLHLKLFKINIYQYYINIRNYYRIIIVYQIFSYKLIAVKPQYLLIILNKFNKIKIINNIFLLYIIF